MTIWINDTYTFPVAGSPDQFVLDNGQAARNMSNSPSDSYSDFWHCSSIATACTVFDIGVVDYFSIEIYVFLETIFKKADLDV